MLSTLSRNEVDIDDDAVLMSIKTPMQPRPTTVRMSGKFRLRESVKQLISDAPKDTHAARVITQLIREQSGAHQFLAVKKLGLEQVDPETTTLADIAIPKEVRTEHGIELMRVASVEIQSYARVGA